MELAPSEREALSGGFFLFLSGIMMIFFSCRFWSLGLIFSLSIPCWIGKCDLFFIHIGLFLPFTFTGIEALLGSV